MKTPRLRKLMESYFHQDYDLNGSDDAAILIEYVQSSWPSDVAATINDIDALLKQPTSGI